jgi:hypothetical protein
VAEESVKLLEKAFAAGRTDVTGIGESVEQDFVWWAGIPGRRPTPTAESAS